MFLQSLKYLNVGTCEINAKNNMFWCIQRWKTNSQSNGLVSNFFLLSHAISHNSPCSVCSKHTVSTLCTLYTIRKCQNALSEIPLPESGWLQVWVAVFFITHRMLYALSAAGLNIERQSLSILSQHPSSANKYHINVSLNYT